MKMPHLYCDIKKSINSQESQVKVESVMGKQPTLFRGKERQDILSTVLVNQNRKIKTYQDIF
ncbi:hypothetical protein A359_05520 [secondary endosymbiont of Ctenarytaina eucalypti]|uniref:Uncharacterized protein n=1 Tax=secondary endosymbiont of Ctenarytaina eucalypti TaxID=1199245 RepID=J3Z3X7_9ENTR|nr:hypothetical protein A359_05520 [secondary endosymbiont of Ctenarytaina eucalypti]